ncbi:MAG: TetR/AcrR family transcriptional regulator [Pseudomonadales bacterium]|nr:TetR/AcrR family transcriptional regulator [Pseudomonadales bacterium]
MSTNKKTVKNQYRKPQQQRSAFTYSVILEAATQLFVARGLKTTTNQIAERAGVSIGTLYQYFPNKGALVSALTEQHLKEMIELITTGLSARLDRPLEEIIETTVTLMIDAHAINPGLHRLLVEESNHSGITEQLKQFEHRLLQLIEAFLEAKRTQLRVQDLKIVSFVIMNTLETLTHRAVLQADSVDISQEGDKDLLITHTCDLITRYLIDN